MGTGRSAGEEEEKEGEEEEAGRETETGMTGGDVDRDDDEVGEVEV